MSKKNKDKKGKKEKPEKVDLDELDIHRGSIDNDEMSKIRNAKFGKGRPSLIARSIAESLFKAPDSGAFIDVDKLSVSQRDGVIKSMKRDLMRIAKATDHPGLRVRVIDQGKRVIFYYDPKRIKEKKDKDKKAR
jgi:hypothetical protein